MPRVNNNETVNNDGGYTAHYSVNVLAFINTEMISAEHFTLTDF